MSHPHYFAFQRHRKTIVKNVQRHAFSAPMTSNFEAFTNTRKTVLSHIDIRGTCGIHTTHLSNTYKVYAVVVEQTHTGRTVMVAFRSMTIAAWDDCTCQVCVFFSVRWCTGSCYSWVYLWRADFRRGTTQCLSLSSLYASVSSLHISSSPARTLEDTATNILLLYYSRIIYHYCCSTV